MTKKKLPLVGFVSVVGMIFFVVVLGVFLTIMAAILRSFLNTLGTHGVSVGALRPHLCC